MLGDLDFPSYSTSVKQFWDESNAVIVVPNQHVATAECECGVNDSLVKYNEEQRLIQFSMGLNNNCTAVRRNIRMMHPLKFSQV